jgi:hypothetical protein
LEEERPRWVEQWLDARDVFGLKGHRFLAKFPQGILVGKQQRNARPNRADFEKLRSYPRREKLCSCFNREIEEGIVGLWK